MGGKKQKHSSVSSCFLFLITTSIAVLEKLNLSFSLNALCFGTHGISACVFLVFASVKNRGF